MATSPDLPPRRNSATANLLRITMGKFLKKKSPEPLSQNDASVHSFLGGSTPPASPEPTNLKKSASRWKKQRKVVEEKPAVDFDLSLPSEDDFRTSLFMPAMTARFSLLREQDDPSSILGKASDDSVLQPRRRSRMDFGLGRGGLDDIAEVSSVRSTKSSLRPQRTDQRQDSFTTKSENHSENNSPHSSVMSRSRPGEGNTMFGGRQKVSIVSKSGAMSNRGGRILYEDDLSRTSFRRFEEEYKLDEIRVSNDSHGFDFGLDQTGGASELGPEDGATTNDLSKDLSDSPSLSSSENKWSTQSTHSEARSSTAATSVASQPGTSTTSPSKVKPSSTAPAPELTPISSPSMQPLKRSDTKLRRMYEQGLDQHMHEQQTSALTRLNSIHKQQHPSNKHPQFQLHSVKSASNLQDKARQPVYAVSDQNSSSPGPLTIPTGHNAMANGDSTLQSPPLSPLPPQYAVDIDEYNTLTQALEPGDRGKATAMGAFNKPKQSFDEEQYLERQRQLQRSVSAAAIKKGQSAKSRFESSANNASLSQDNADFESFNQTRLRSQSASKDVGPDHSNDAFQHAVQDVYEQPDVINADSSNSHVLNLAKPTSSDGEEEHDSFQSDHPAFRLPDYRYAKQQSRWQNYAPPSSSEHPAFRLKTPKASPAREELPTQTKPPPAALTLTQIYTDLPKIQTPTEETVPDISTGDQVSQPLSGLVHHLRQKSNVSSISRDTDRTSFTEPVDFPELTSQNLNLMDASAQRSLSPGSRIGSYAQSNPWDLDEVDNVVRADYRESHASISPIDNDHISPFDARFSSFKNRQSAVSELELDEDDRFTGPRVSAMQQHSRDDSTGTQQDREAFDNELAARASAIQEKLKIKTESEKQARGVSPARRVSGGFKAFGMLRSQPSRESVVESSQIPDTSANPLPKTNKVYGSNVPGAHSSTSTLGSQRTSDAHSLDINQSRDDLASRPPVPSIDPRILRQSEQDSKRQIQQSRSRENSEVEPFPPTNRSPPTSSEETRSRTNSVATSGRSRSRTGPYRDDLEKAMVEGTGSTAIAVPELTPVPHWELTPRSTPESIQTPFDRPRAGSGSRVGGMTAYFDAKSLHPAVTGSRERLTPAAPSPGLSPGLSPAMYSPMLSPSPLSPAGSFAHNMTPPLSGASTPIQQTFTPTLPVPNSLPNSSSRSGGILRKKTISKGDISEPTLISSTSNIELVDLPEGASLRNGMDEPPPLPPINPARRATKRILGLGRKESSDHSGHHGSRSKTPEAHYRRPLEADVPFDVVQAARKRSDNQSPQKSAPIPSFDATSHAKTNGHIPNGGSPKSIDHGTSPPAAIAYDGGMF